jgi:acyl-CoA dehydrogenase family protein 9
MPLLEQSFMKALFHGVIAEDMIFPFPEMPGDDRDNTSLILDSVRRFFAASVDSAKIDREHQIPAEVMDGLKSLGLFGLQIPTEYDGIGLSATSYARVMQEIAGHDGSIAVTLGAHQSIGLKGILLFGTPEQKRKYLPKLATGEQVAAFALTEPGAGSDAANIKTRAELSARRLALHPERVEDLDHQRRLRRRVHGLRPHLSPSTPEGHKPKITAFIVERGYGRALGAQRAQARHPRLVDHVEMYFDDVTVPSENVLGEAGAASRWRWRCSTAGAWAWPRAAWAARRSSCA